MKNWKAEDWQILVMLLVVLVFIAGMMTIVILEALQGR